MHFVGSYYICILQCTVKKNVKLHVNYIARLLESLRKGSCCGLLQGTIAQNSAWMELGGGFSAERSKFELSEY